MVRYNFSAVFFFDTRHEQQTEIIGRWCIHDTRRIKHSFFVVGVVSHVFFALLCFLFSFSFSLLFIARIELSDVPFGVPNKLGLFHMRFLMMHCIFFVRSLVRFDQNLVNTRVLRRAYVCCLCFVCMCARFCANVENYIQLSNATCRQVWKLCEQVPDSVKTILICNFMCAK